MSDIADNLDRVRERIARAEQRAGRPAGCVTLLAVSKTQAAPAVRAAYAAGQRQFGESYVQEALAKMDALGDLEAQWHFIGPIQSNKTRSIATRFDWVHSLDRLKIAQRLSDQRPEGRAPLQVCLQVNISGEQAKSGADPAEVPELAAALAAQPRLRLRGLMAIPAAQTDPHRQRTAFAGLRRLQEDLLRGGLPLDTLSMGMSGDLEAAILEGATLVRIGTAIFGQRPPARE